MARPTKQGLDYFSLDCDFDDEAEELIAEFGNDALAFLIRFWQAAYKREDGCIDCSRIVRRTMFEQRANVRNHDLFEAILARSMQLGLVDQEAYEERQVLTSKGIQKRLETVRGEREKARNRMAYQRNNCSANNSRTTPERSPIVRPKVKESKVKSTLTNVSVPERREKASSLATRETLFSDADTERLHAKMPADEARFWLEELETKFQAEKSYFKKYSDPVAVALSWRRIRLTRDGLVWNAEKQIYEKQASLSATERKHQREQEVFKRAAERDAKKIQITNDEPKNLQELLNGKTRVLGIA